MRNTAVIIGSCLRGGGGGAAYGQTTEYTYSARGIIDGVKDDILNSCPSDP